MPVTNLLKRQVDLPVFEWLRPAPVATSAVFSASYDGSRYLYYHGQQVFWRYDTYSDSWQELQAFSNIASLNAIKHSSDFGYQGTVLNATSTTFTMAGFGPISQLGDNLKVRIIAGTGAGQERTITSIENAIIHDYGVVTGGSNNNIFDTAKKWRVNQWRGYQIRTTFNTGQGQVRKIIFNTNTRLATRDITSYIARTPYNNTDFGLVSPFAAPSSTSGSQTHYTIESNVANIDSPWNVIPDQTSVYLILGGGIWLFGLTSFTPTFSSLFYYDVLSDSWQSARSGLHGYFNAQPSSESSITLINEGGTGFISGLTATSATLLSLTNSGASMEFDRWANHKLKIIDGKGIGQERRIVGNNNNTFFVNHTWGVTLDSTSVYQVSGDSDKLWMSVNGSAALFHHSTSKNIWSPSHIVDSGVARNISITSSSGSTYEAPVEGVAATSITYSASGVLTVAVNNAGGTYQPGDLVTLTTTGSNGQAYVTGITANGAVASLQLASSGSGYVAGTSTTSGGSGSALTVTITVGKVANVVTATDHDFRHNETVTIAGCTTDNTFNNNFSIIGTNSITGFSIATPSANTSPTALTSQSITTLVDASQNWNVNQHVGRILYLITQNTDALIASRKILSNTATTITVSGSAITTPTNGTTRYIIAEPRGFGAMVTTKVNVEQPYGWATSGTATTLVDTTKNWRVNQWINCRVRVMCGTGEGNESIITSNTSNTLTVASWNVATPDATSKYEILDSFGIVTTAGTTTLTDAQKNWETNNLIGKRVRIIAGSGIGSEATITANTATVLTLSASITTDTVSGNGSCYVIYEPPARGAGYHLQYLGGLSNINNKGRWIISPRGGGSNLFDIYDIPSNTWQIGLMISPISVTLTTGSMYAYDGADSYFFTKEATGRIYELNLNTFETYPATTTPYAHNTAVIGNRMEVATTSDGLKYLYVMRHSAQEMWRTLKFW